LGYAGTGKTYIGKIIAKEIPNSVFIDKDTLTHYFVESLLEKMQVLQFLKFRDGSAYT